MRVFVTGVSGYGGFYVALRLTEAGHEVVGLVRKPQQPRLNVLRAHEVRLVVGDVSDPGSYRDELARSEAVVHTVLDKGKARETDRALFEALAEAAPPPGGRPRRLIYTTGASIYGSAGVLVSDETSPPPPNHPLAFRHELEQEALQIANAAVTVVRPCFMFGNDGHNSVTSDWFAMALEGDPVFRGDRERGWSWIHVDDLAEAYRLVVEAPDGVAGEVFNVADDRFRLKSLDVMRACLAAAGFAGEPRFEEPMKGDSLSTWFNRNEFVSAAKARRVLGWSPRHPSVVDAAPAAYAAWTAARAGDV